MKKLIVTEESLERAKKFARKQVHPGYSVSLLMFEKIWDVLYVPEQDNKTEKPKPIGPGTHLRAANGDELLIIKYGACWGIVNLKNNEFGDTNIALGWWTPGDLIKQLEVTGATMIEKDSQHDN